jgi:hypothetical protein
MENLAFIHHAIAYEDLSPEPKLRSLKELEFNLFSSAWLTVTSVLVILNILSNAAGVQALISKVKVSTNGGTLYGRTGPGTRHAWRDYYSNGSILNTTGETRNGWHKLTNGLWVAGKWVVPVEYNIPVSAAKNSGTVKVSTNGGRLHGRKGPGTHYLWATHYPNGTVLNTTGETQNGWYKLTNGLWVSGTWVSDEQQPNVTLVEASDEQSPIVAETETTEIQIASLPEFDWFQFNNEELTKEIESNPLINKWVQFEETATQYPNETETTIAQPGFGSSTQVQGAKTYDERYNSPAFDETYWKPVLFWLFGGSTCVNDNAANQNECILSAPTRRWIRTQIELMRYGVCEGMAAANLYLWYHLKHPDDKLTSLTIDFNRVNPEKRPIQQLKKNDPLLHALIMELFVLQTIEDIYNQTKTIREKEKPSRIRELVTDSIASVQNADKNQRDDFRNKVNELYTIGIYQSENGELQNGHTLTPFRVTRTNDGKYKVYVYDSNHPERSDLFIEFNGEKWSYESPDKQLNEGDENTDIYKGDENTDNLDLTRIAWRNLGENEYFKCPYCGDNPSDPSDKRDGTVDVVLDGEGQLNVENLGSEDQEKGIFPFKGGLNKEISPTYNISSGKNYRVTVNPKQAQSSPSNNSTSPGSFSLQMLGYEFIVGVQGVNLEEYKTLQIDIANTKQGLTLVLEAEENMDIPTLFINVADATEGKNNSFEFTISGVNLKKGKSVFISMNTEARHVIIGDNDNETDTYNFVLRLINGDTGNTGHSIAVGYEFLKEEIAWLEYGQWQKSLSQAFQDGNLTDNEANQLPFYFATWEGSNSLGSDQLLEQLTKGKAINEDAQQKKPPKQGTQKTVPYEMPSPTLPPSP